MLRAVGGDMAVHTELDPIGLSFLMSLWALGFLPLGVLALRVAHERRRRRAL